MPSLLCQGVLVYLFILFYFILFIVCLYITLLINLAGAAITRAVVRYIFHPGYSAVLFLSNQPYISYCCNVVRRTAKG